MTKYREIIRLASLNLSQTNIALSCGVSMQTATFRGQQGRISRPVKAILSGRL